MTIYIGDPEGISWAAARDKVRGDLWRPGVSGVPDDVCDRALHASLLELEGKRRWLWLEDWGILVPGGAGATQVPVPPSIRSVATLALRCADGRLEGPLVAVPIGRVRMSASQMGSGGRPSAYALSHNTIFLDHALPGDIHLDVIFSARTPADLRLAVLSPNAALQLHQSVAIAGACAQVALTFLRNDAEFARQRQAFEIGVNRLMEEEDDARADADGGLVIPDTTYQMMANGC